MPGDGPFEGPPLRVALVYDAVYPWVKGGGETYLYELACELRDRCHEVHLFSMHCWDGPPDLVREGLHYHAVCPSLPLYNAAGRRTLGQALRFGWGFFRRLPRLHLERFDVVNLVAFPYFSVLAFWLARGWLPARRSPWILTWLEVWGPDYWRRYLGRLGRAGAAVERLCGWAAPTHLCISRTTAGRLCDLLGVSPERTHTIPSGFSPPEESLPIATSDGPKAVVAGRLLDYKRVDLAVRAWAGVRHRVPDAVLHVIGDGPERPSLERLAVELGVAGAVRFLGQLPRRGDVLAEIASATLLLQPSLREGQSRVVLEAMYLGVPVLAADGPETAVGDFLAGGAGTDPALLPVEAGPDVWAERVAGLLKDPMLLSRLAERGRAAAGSFHWGDSIAPRVERLYRSRCQSRRRPAGADNHTPGRQEGRRAWTRPRLTST